jgi:hypothetical protein
MTELKDYKEIEKALNTDFIMIIAKSHTCGACQTIQSSLEQNVPNLSTIKKHTIYIDDLDKFRGEHLIFSVPTVLVFSHGKELLRESRYINYDKITRLIKLHND